MLTPISSKPGTLGKDAPLAMLFMTTFAALWALIEGIFVVRLQRQYDLTQIVWCRYAVHLILGLVIWGRHDRRGSGSRGVPSITSFARS